MKIFFLTEWCLQFDTARLEDMLHVFVHTLTKGDINSCVSQIVMTVLHRKLQH